MKSLTAVCQTGASMPAINPNGRISRHPHHRGDGENAEMKMYLSKLKDLVPFMPKNRKLSKLEIIQHVIDYICDLQSELETHPDVGNFDPESALNYATAQNGSAANEDLFAERLAVDVHNHQQQQTSSPATRQPLVDRQAPNTILPKTMGISSNSVSVTVAAAAMQVQHQQQQQQQQQQMLAAAQSPQTSEDKDDTTTSSGSGSSSRQQC